ncbi:MAG: Arabinose efflux permease [Rhodobacteraceae bacterium HLUCCO18]|nr:MAG: Arabinose efflux permease [Rhodobacteraceae bacterium HLUCCO18]
MIAGGAFRDPQFARFFVGVFFAVQAIWVQRVTLAWLAWERTGSAGFVGLVAALGLAPTLVAGPLFGVMADRVDIRRAALATNGIMAGILAVLALSLPLVGAWGVAAAALAIGITSSAHHPVRMSLGPRLVAREMVQHVVSVTALNFNLARLVAPVIAGWIIASAGAGVALWVAVLCYIPMLAILPLLRPRALPPRARAPFLQELRGGLRFAADAPLIREALILTLVFATLVRGALEVLPVLADGAFGQGAAGLGMLTAAAGAGALVSAMLKAWGAGAAGASIPRSVLAAMALGFAAVAGMGLAPVWPLALLATALAGFTATWCGVSLQAAIQTDLPDAYRGRVMSLWTVVGVGAVAIGAGLIGVLAELFGIGPALVLAGCTGVFGMALWRIGGARG